MFYQKKQAPTGFPAVACKIHMVEMRGVEPLSERTSAMASTRISAVLILSPTGPAAG